MTTDDLIARFEDRTLPAADFRHAQHVEAAWGYLRRYPLGEAFARFSAALQRFAAANGAPGKYDAAVTRGWVMLIADRMLEANPPDWHAFAARHPELLDVTRERRAL